MLPCEFITDCVSMPPLEFMPVLVSEEVVEDTLADWGLEVFVCAELRVRLKISGGRRGGAGVRP